MSSPWYAPSDSPPGRHARELVEVRGRPGSGRGAGRHARGTGEHHVGEGVDEGSVDIRVARRRVELLEPGRRRPGGLREPLPIRAHGALDRRQQAAKRGHLAAVGPGQERHLPLLPGREDPAGHVRQQPAVHDRPDRELAGGAQLLDDLQEIPRGLAPQLVRRGGAGRGRDSRPLGLGTREPRRDERERAALRDRAVEEAVGRRRGHQGQQVDGAGGLAERGDPVRDRRRTRGCWP